MIKQKEQPAMRQYCACGCGETFERKDRGRPRQYYSQNCIDRAGRARKREKQICACGCGQEFYPRGGGQQYYSKKCGERFRRYRNREKIRARAVLRRSGNYKPDTSSPAYRPFEERFWEKVEKTNECWLWKGKPDKHYGRIDVDGKQKLAHRVSYELAYGSIPESTRVSHSCNNPLCVRPDHLFCTTPLTVLWWSAITLLDEKARYLL